MKLTDRYKTRLAVAVDPVTGKAELKLVRSPTRLRLPKHPSGKNDSKALFDEIRKGMLSNPSGEELMANPHFFWWDTLGPRSFFGSFFILQDPQSTPEERGKAAKRLALIIKGKSKDPWANKAVGRLDKKKREIHAQEAILLSMVRKSKDGWPLRYENLLRESRRLFEEMAVEDVFGHPIEELRTRFAGKGKKRNPPLRDINTDLDKARTPHKAEILHQPTSLSELIASEAAKLNQTELFAILKRSTKNQERLLRGALSLLEKNPDMKVSEALQKAADQIKMSPTHKRKTLHSIRHKTK